MASVSLAVGGVMEQVIVTMTPMKMAAVSKLRMVDAA